MARPHPIKTLLPREHAANAWVVVPLVAAVWLSPHLHTVLAGIGLIAGYGSMNAWGRHLRAERVNRTVVGVALLVAAVSSGFAIAGAERPMLLAATLCAAGLAATVGTVATGGRLPRSRALEVVGISGLAALGAAVAVSTGSEPGQAVALLAVVATWELVGLWVVTGLLATVLRNRSAITGWVPAGAVVTGATTALAAGQPQLLWLFPLLGVRVATATPPESPRHLKRVGFTELAWCLLATSVGGLLLVLT